MNQIIQKAVEILKNGGVIAFPTDTVYGIGCSIFNGNAIQRIYKIKGRDFNKPLPILLSKVEDINLYAQNISDEAFDIINKYLPGPLTVILEKSGLVSDMITAGQMTVAIRVVDNPLVVKIISLLGSPIVATSANKSGSDDPLTSQDVIKSLGSDIDFVVDGGPCKIGTPSTIVDLTVRPFKVVRQGNLTLA